MNKNNNIYSFFFVGLLFSVSLYGGSYGQNFYSYGQSSSQNSYGQSSDKPSYGQTSYGQTTVPSAEEKGFDDKKVTEKADKLKDKKEVISDKKPNTIPAAPPLPARGIPMVPPLPVQPIVLPVLAKASDKPSSQNDHLAAIRTGVKLNSPKRELKVDASEQELLKKAMKDRRRHIDDSVDSQ